MRHQVDKVLLNQSKKNTCPRPGPEEILERILPGRARMMVLVGITLPDHFWAELKILLGHYLRFLAGPLTGINHYRLVRLHRKCNNN